MAVTLRQISGSISALAMALSALAASTAAQAQMTNADEVFERDTPRQAPQSRRSDESRPMPRTMPSDGGWTQPARPARAEFPRPAPVAAPATPAVTQGQAAEAYGRGNWDRGAARGERQGSWGGNRDGWSRNRGGEEGQGGRWNGGTPRPAAPVATPAPQAPSATPAPQARSWSDRSGWSRGDDSRRRDGSGWSRDGRNWRDGRSDDRRWDNDRRGEDRSWSRDRDRNRDGNWNRDRNGWDSRSRYGYGQDHRRWDNRWRDNRRYDWYSYRRSYPNTYRLPSYYAPYRNYSYRRLSIGFYLDSLFFSSRYYINDPWQYRLPDVYGPYRWVRYYDDALLVNVYTGEVVDVIYSFFW
jgi:hypothetical protein